MKTSSCIFCGKTPVTKEDLFSKWILRLLAREFDTVKCRKGSSSRSSADAYWESDQPNRTVVKCVCRPCNNGWMSELERAAKPTLASLILGEGVALDTEMQETIAKWATLKAMIGAYSWGTHPIPADWLAHFYREHRPPNGWHVTTTRYIGKNLQILDSHRVTLHFASSDQSIPTSTENKAILTTLIVGYFAVNIWAIRERTPLNVRSFIVKLWPTSPLALLWPPDVQITDGRTLNNFRRMGFEPGPKLFNLPPR